MKNKSVVYVREYARDNGIVSKVAVANQEAAKKRKKALLDKLRGEYMKRKPKKWYDKLWDFITRSLKRNGLI